MLLKEDALLKPDFDSLSIVRETKLKNILKLLFCAFICNIAQLSSSFSWAAILKNDQKSQNSFFKNPIEIEY